MLDNYEHIANLITGFNNGTLSATGHNELNEWITANHKNQQLFEELSDPNRLREYLQQMEGYDEGGSWEKIKLEIPLTTIPVRHLPWKKIAVAASIILAFGVGAYFAFFNKTEKKQDIAELPVLKDVEAPKGTKAMITLADGKQISIDSLTTLRQGNVTITRTKDGKVIYSSSSTLGEAGVRYNTLNNPRGSKVIDMTLADGSHVWLNAGSSVTYPVSFIGNERKISMEGEAYFEVAHNSSMPFIVQKKEVNIKVLGTHFNVNAYDDEAGMTITLLEGSVNVSKGSQSSLLKPGQQAQVSNEIKVINGVDIDAVMAWKNGLFSFNRADIKTIMRQLARWYDLEVEYKGQIPQREFSGEMQRDLPLSGMMRLLEKGNVHLKLEGKKLVVLK